MNGSVRAVLQSFQKLIEFLLGLHVPVSKTRTELSSPFFLSSFFFFLLFFFFFLFFFLFFFSCLKDRWNFTFIKIWVRNTFRSAVLNLPRQSGVPCDCVSLNAHIQAACRKSMLGVWCLAFCTSARLTYGPFTFTLISLTSLTAVQSSRISVSSGDDFLWRRRVC